MPSEDRSRARRSPDPIGAWSLLEYQARYRMDELVHDMEQERLARRARGVVRSTSTWPTTAIIAALVSGARSALAVLARGFGGDT
jgi:hypothetical protein